MIRALLLATAFLLFSCAAPEGQPVKIPKHEEQKKVQLGKFNFVPAKETFLARKDYAAVFSEEKRSLYVWGGEDIEGNLVRDGVEYHNENGWKSITEVGAPSPRRHASITVYKNKLVVWGGQQRNSNNNGYLSLNDGSIYNLATRGWENSLPQEDAPTARYGHHAFATDKELIIWGGFFDGRPLNDGGILDFKTLTWRPISTIDAPNTALHQAAIRLGDRIYAWHSDDDSASGSYYDTTTDTWYPLSSQDSPILKEGYSITPWKDGFIIWGGCGVSNGSFYSPTTNTWTAMGSLAADLARCDHSAVAINKYLFIWGGRDEDFIPDGRIIDPERNLSISLPLKAATARIKHQSFWTGETLVFWGGQSTAGKPLASGYAFTPDFKQIDAVFAKAALK